MARMDEPPHRCISQLRNPRPAGASSPCPQPPAGHARRPSIELFRCQHCDQVLYFENTKCERCGHRLGFLPEVTRLSALEPGDGNEWQPLAKPDQRRLFCSNAQYDACNWLVPEGTTDAHLRRLPAQPHRP